MMDKLNCHTLLFLMCLSIVNVVFGQDKITHPGTKTLDRLISENKLTQAKKVLDSTVAKLSSSQSYYYLTDYIYYSGKINQELFGTGKGTEAAVALIKQIAASTDSVKVNRQAHIEMAGYWELIGNSQKAYESNQEALYWTSKWGGATPEHFGFVESNLGTLANRKGDIANGLNHQRKALKYYESYPSTDKKNLYILYNSIGGSMWHISKIDSALYFYEKAEKTLKLLKPDPINLYYRPAHLKNNIAGIYSSQGNTDKALETMRSTINLLTKFIASDSVPNSKKESAQEFLFQAIENYGGIYKEMGDYGKAKDLLEYAYQQKQRYFDKDNPELFKAKILLGQIYLALKDYILAEKFLDDGLAHIDNTDGGNAYWAGDAHFAKATINEDLGNITIAEEEYQKAEALYEGALQGAYDAIYLDFIFKATHFYANNNHKDKAILMAHKAYDYIVANQGSTTSFEIQQALNLGEIYYILGDYKQALEKSHSTLELLKKTLPTQSMVPDSAQYARYKPEVILLKSKSAYKLAGQKDMAFLKKEFAELKQAIAILENRKTVLGDESNTSLMIQNNAELFEFAKQLALDLYLTSKDKNYLQEVLSLHESILYNRIRSRLNSKESIAYIDMPEKIMLKEAVLKKNLKQALGNNDGIDAFFKAKSDWDSYLEMLKKDYPKYYKLRFASITKSLNNSIENIPENTTVIRYAFVGNQLYAFVVSSSETQLFELDQSHLKERITRLLDEKQLFHNDFELLKNLYDALWRPFENTLKTEHVVIVPDRELFNLNFEMLTPSTVGTYRELASNSLLSKYIISYNYSLFLIDKGSKTVGIKDNFVAFVPEFNQQMKKNYQIAIKDSLDLDRAYMTLLPQPFTKKLAKISKRLFKGESFLNEKSTEHIFKNSAREHKIIHIGTHAESNNVSPELSRLVFAKSTDSLENEDGYLYTYEIYNTNLSSNLAILTACETGKPTYQAGEGMISLAHAFNYAGSESILTSLWKIDEQSSAKIVEQFYKHIKKGWAKDKALQQAKLDYIASAEGRTVHPQYWAGLVLIGDTAPIDLQTTEQWLYWVLAGIALLIAFLFFRSRKKA